MAEYEGWDPSDYDEDGSSFTETDWDVDIYTVRDLDGNLEYHSQETDAYRFYGMDEKIAQEVAEAQGIAGDNSPSVLMQHFSGTADQRDMLRRR